MAVIASAAATFLHEGIGHGLTAWLRGAVPTELTSNHMSDLHPDNWVEAGGTLVNLLVGTIALIASQHSGHHANRRYFLWLLAALNLLPGAGYFLFSGVFGFGDWYQIVQSSPYVTMWRIAMALFGALLYVLVVRQLAFALRPFLPDRPTYNAVARLPYYAACLFSCVAGVLDPMGLKLLFVSTIPAAFGGSSGLMWADSFLQRQSPFPPDRLLFVGRSRAFLIAAIIIGLAYILILGPGIRFPH